MVYTTKMAPLIINLIKLKFSTGCLYFWQTPIASVTLLLTKYYLLAELLYAGTLYLNHQTQIRREVMKV
jgi:hypothetical protein